MICKVFPDHLFTEKPKQYSCRILLHQYSIFASQFEHFQQSDDYTKFEFNFQKTIKKSAVFGKMLPEKKKTISTRFSFDNWHKLKGKQNYKCFIVRFENPEP